MRVVVVGSGAVGEMLTRALVPIQVWTRRTHAPGELAAADLYIIAVTDGAIGEVSRELPFPTGAVVAHTAGGVSLSELDARIEHRAVIYPLQTFTRGRVVAGGFPVFVEGSTPHAREAARAAAEELSGTVREMSSEARARLHLAAVVANNFTNAMLSWSERLLDGDFDVLRPLVAETVVKAMELSPRKAQTGPAKRGDKAVMDSHLAILSEPDERELYNRVSELIWKISKNG